MGSLIAAAIARAHGFLLEPATPVEPAVGPIAPARPGPCCSVHVVVTGLSRDSGATTVAAGLAQALARPAARSAHLISLPVESGGARRAPVGVAAWELPPALRNADEIADYGATLARLAAGGGEAAVVWDVRADEIARAARTMENCDVLVCVAAGTAEPPLCALVCDMLAERYGRVLLVANRVGEEDAWSGRCALAVPDARLAAIRLGRGWRAGGALGAAMSQLAALVDEQT